jgi:hypothetical protein
VKLDLSPAVVDETRGLLEALAEGMVEPWMKATATRLIASFKGRARIGKPAAPGTTKRQRKASRATAARVEYDAVVARDARCTVRTPALGPCSGPLHIDHHWGRGKAPTLRQNCRRLCLAHDRAKTDNRPTRLAWLLDFRIHAELHGYAEEVAKTDGQIALERAQHPENA